MRAHLRFSVVWRFLRAKAARVNRPLSHADGDDMVFQVHSWEKKPLEDKAPPASSGGNGDKGAN
jgi:hypothetical protein